MVQQASYDIVLMDMQMPVMDGLDATREIRHLEQFAQLPIIAMTANTMQGDPEKCFAVGMNDFVAKPIDPELLWATLLKWIRPGTFTASAALPTGAVDLDAVVLPAAIDGVDMAVGLKRVVGNKALYLAMLRKFVAGQRSTPVALRAALDEEDLGAAERIAHTAKSVAGNIGAAQVQAAAAELESSIKSRVSRISLNTQIVALEALLLALIAQLEVQLPSEHPDQVGVIDPAKLKVVTGQLAELLANYNSAALDVIDENGDLLRPALKDAYARMAAAVQNFDFDLALTLLNAAMESHRTT